MTEEEIIVDVIWEFRRRENSITIKDLERDYKLIQEVLKKLAEENEK